MNKINIMAALCGVGLAVAAATAWAGDLDGAKYLKNADVTLKQARTSALEVVNGVIVAQELEKGPGGSGLRYSFDINKGDITHEVGVDAKTGKILENSIEGSDED